MALTISGHVLAIADRYTGGDRRWCAGTPDGRSLSAAQEVIMANVEDELEQSGGYLLAEWQGANKASGIGKRAWVRKAYPGVSYNAWWGRVYRAQKAISYGATDARPDLFSNFIEEEQTLDGDWMIVSDVHAPCTNYDLAQLVTAIAERHLPNCQGLIVAGDFLNADAFSNYKNLIKLPSWPKEIEAAKHLITMWLETFGRIVWLMGNHEHRKLSADGGETTVEQLHDLVWQDDRVTISSLDRCYINTSNGKWLIAHGANYSRNQLVNPSQYAIKYQCNVISGHEHHLAIGQDLYKRYTVVNNGGLFDPHKLAYVRLKTTTSPEMAPGFTMLRNGFAHVFGEDHYTDWEMWLGNDNEFVIPRAVAIPAAA